MGKPQKTSSHESKSPFDQLTPFAARKKIKSIASQYLTLSNMCIRSQHLKNAFKNEYTREFLTSGYHDKEDHIFWEGCGLELPKENTHICISYYFLWPILVLFEEKEPGNPQEIHFIIESPHSVFQTTSSVSVQDHPDQEKTVALIKECLLMSGASDLSDFEKIIVNLCNIGSIASPEIQADAAKLILDMFLAAINKLLSEPARQNLCESVDEFKLQYTGKSKEKQVSVPGGILNAILKLKDIIVKNAQPESPTTASEISEMINKHAYVLEFLINHYPTNEQRMDESKNSNDLVSNKTSKVIDVITQRVADVLNEPKSTYFLFTDFLDVFKGLTQVDVNSTGKQHPTDNSQPTVTIDFSEKKLDSTYLIWPSFIPDKDMLTVIKYKKEDGKTGDIVLTTC